MQAGLCGAMPEYDRRSPKFRRAEMSFWPRRFKIFFVQNVAGMWLKYGAGPKTPYFIGVSEIFALRDDFLTMGVDNPGWEGL